MLRPGLVYQDRKGSDIFDQSWLSSASECALLNVFTTFSKRFVAMSCHRRGREGEFKFTRSWFASNSRDPCLRPAQPKMTICSFPRNVAASGFTTTTPHEVKHENGRASEARNELHVTQLTFHQQRSDEGKPITELTQDNAPARSRRCRAQRQERTEYRSFLSPLASSLTTGVASMAESEQKS